MSYEPKPGSVPARAIAHLASLPPGAELMTSPLAEAINVPPVTLLACMDAPLKAGLIFRRQRDTRIRSPMWWSLTDRSGEDKEDHMAARVPADTAAKPDDGKPVQRTIPAVGAPPLPIVPPLFPNTAVQECRHEDRAVLAALPSSFGQKIEKRREVAQQAVRRVHDPEVAGSSPALASLPLRAALWSDGQLELRRGTTCVALLDPDESRSLIDYLVAVRAGE